MLTVMCRNVNKECQSINEFFVGGLVGPNTDYISLAETLYAESAVRKHNTFTLTTSI